MEPGMSLENVKYKSMSFPRVGHKFESKLFRSQPKNRVRSRAHNVPEIKERQTIQGNTAILGAKTRQKFLQRQLLER